ncbi:hypothetical protein E2C01_085761 [Portunus trituberculatus]|uniref:Uncharacterized protein n=1 Tax=Portunus trituberculatus TaxID=210409 RepID=A0A5B7J8F8_PORTR|nr:hypothetical protein [Portunus trituberculatus]
MIPAGDRPSLIIIDDLHFFSYRENIDAASQLMNTAKILSLAQESAEFCTNSPGVCSTSPLTTFVK